MELRYQGILPEEGSPVHEAVAAARYYTTRDIDEPWIFGYGPVVRGNPYQSLAYRSFGDHGLALTPVTDPWSFAELTHLGGQSRGVVYHLHWLSFVHQGVNTARKAAEQSNRFLSLVRRFRQNGGRLIWTVHNMVSHDARFPDEELRLQQSVANEADLIHVMSEDTPELVRGVLDLPAEKVLCVPHPSYLGAYEDYVSRDQARLMLGLEPDEIVYVVLGAIKAYKGIERLLDAFTALLERSPKPRRLIVAGSADQDESTQDLVRRLRMHPYVLLQDRRVPGDEVQRLLRAADLMVLPHERALNSGGALLGPSFDLPIVASDVGVLPGLLPAEFTEFFDGPSAPDVSEALERADRLVDEAPRRAARSFAEEYHSLSVSHQFAVDIRERLGLDADLPV
ncbi:glycosyltransferase family 4 protein [Cellulosimicrobium funkei]|nr:glycosyltransferase family 4 protein [Cellulosimicrobium funkei]